MKKGCDIMRGKSNRLIIETNFIKEALKNKLSLNEFLFLTFFDNSFETIFDVSILKEVLAMPEEEILETYSALLSKKIIKVEQIKNEDGKICEKISLEPFYQNMVLQEKEKEKKQTETDIFTIFENEFGRTLSPVDYEIINAWIEKGYSEDLIVAALKEATYNGVNNLRYIDKVLYEWHKKGIKNAQDVRKNWQSSSEEIPLYETKYMEFDWLNESK